MRRAGVLAVTIASMTIPNAMPAAGNHVEQARTASSTIIPAPASFSELEGQTFQLTDATTIVVLGDDPDVTAVAERFAAWLRRSTGFALPVGATGDAGNITLELSWADSYDDEGYTLYADSTGVLIRAATAEGHFRGVTTLRQMLPVAAEAATVHPGPWTVPGAGITDAPRFEYRGVMLDVARHFFSVDDVLRVIDLISLYKVNHLHLHLTDDQGWRLTVRRRPVLTEVGGPTDIDGGPGGAYSEDDFARIVAYAAEHFVEIVPEIDLPGHSTAALRAYPDLGCDGAAPPPYTQAGISTASLCVGTPAMYDFLGDVYAAVVTQSPGRFIHIGADEAIATEHEDFLTFVPAASELVVERGRRVIAWHEAAQAGMLAGTVLQYWGVGDPTSTGWARAAVDAGHDVILSPANHAYLDMKYDDDTPFGLAWAGHVPVSAAYAWDPGTLIDGVPERSILGVEAALWSETIADLAAVEYMTFPRAAGTAEIGWSPAAALSWDEYRLRVAAHGPRWDLLGVNYFRSPEVPWPAR